MTTLEGKTSYGYDLTGQLTSVALASGRSIEYKYDAAGNRITVKDSGATTNYSTNNLNQYTTVGGNAYTYDKDGNLTSKTIGGKTTTFSYDIENRLIGVTNADGTWQYQYDALGNRIGSTFNGQKTDYLLDPTGLGDVVGEYTGSQATRYSHGLGLVSRNDGTNTSFFDTDAIGSVVGLSGTGGNYLNSYSYLPFGESLTKTETVANSFEYVGQYGVMNEANGLDFMRARFYTSGEGRFLNPDPIGINGGLNLYGYTNNNSINLIDPSGKSGVGGVGGGGGGRFIPTQAPASSLNPIEAVRATPRIPSNLPLYQGTTVLEGEVILQQRSAAALQRLLLLNRVRSVGGVIGTVAIIGLFVYAAIRDASRAANANSLTPEQLERLKQKLRDDFGPTYLY